MTSDTGQIVIDLPIRLELREVLRMMGYGGARPHETIRSAAERMLEETRPILHPRGVYRVCEVERMTDTRIDLAGWPSFHGPIAGFLKPSRRVAVCVVTVGNATQELAEQRLKKGDIFAGYALHAIGAAAADAASDAISLHLRDHEAADDEDVTPPFSPGYCGMALEEQKTLFAIVDGGAIGVRLLPTMIMEPVKSVSGLIGIGLSADISERGVPCQWCDLTACKMRR